MHLISSIAESALCNVQGSMAHVLRFQSFYSNIYGINYFLWYMKWVNLNKRAPGCNRIVLCIDCYDVAVLFIFTVTVCTIAFLPFPAETSWPRSCVVILGSWASNLGQEAPRSWDLGGTLLAKILGSWGG